MSIEINCEDDIKKLFNSNDCYDYNTHDIDKISQCIIRNNITNYMDILYDYYYLLTNNKINIDQIINDLDNNNSIYNHYNDIILQYDKLLAKDNKEIQVGIYYCNACRGPYTLSYSKQTRSGDEGQTAFLKCFNSKCGVINKLTNQKMVSERDRKKLNLENKKKKVKSKKVIKNIKNVDLKYGREKIYYIINTIFELLTDRGYFIPIVDLQYIREMVRREDCNERNNYQDRCEVYDNGSCFCKVGDDIQKEHFKYKCKNKDGEEIVFFYRYIEDSSKVSINEIRKILKTLKEIKIYNFILCSNNDVSQKSMESIIRSGFTYTVYNDDNIIRNPTKHNDVPKHVLIGEDEKKELVKKGYKLNQLPIILINDPIAKYYGVKKGDIFFIDRSTEYDSDCLFRIVV